MNLTFISPTDVRGPNNTLIGPFADSIANRPDISPADFQRALEAAWDEREAEHAAALAAKDAECAERVANNDELEAELVGFKAIIDEQVLPAAQALLAKLAQDRDVDSFIVDIAAVMSAASKGPLQRELEKAQAAEQAAAAKKAELEAKIAALPA